MMTEDDNEMKWRDLALQFDGHRMQAISFLKVILSGLPDNQYVSARDFIKSGPLSGEEVLRNRIAALTQPASPALKLPDGWVAVPLEPTEEMVAAWRDDMEKSYAKEHAIKIGEDEIVFAHQAMLAAAPAVPHTAPIEPICATGGAEWVKVSDELPEKSGIYWCFFGNEKCSAIQQRVMTFSAHHKEFNDYGVTHWMPRPAAPEEE